MINFTLLAALATGATLFCLVAGAVFDDRVHGRRDGSAGLALVIGFSLGALVFGLGYLARGAS